MKKLTEIKEYCTAQCSHKDDCGGKFLRLNETVPEAPVNAHLIAAAPDMYEALKELVASEKHRTTFRAEQALAKAEGETI